MASAEKSHRQDLLTAEDFAVANDICSAINTRYGLIRAYRLYIDSRLGYLCDEYNREPLADRFRVAEQISEWVERAGFTIPPNGFRTGDRVKIMAIDNDDEDAGRIGTIVEPYSNGGLVRFDDGSERSAMSDEMTLYLSR